MRARLSTRTSTRLLWLPDRPHPELVGGQRAKLVKEFMHGEEEVSQPTTRSATRAKAETATSEAIVTTSTECAVAAVDAA